MFYNLKIEKKLDRIVTAFDNNKKKKMRNADLSSTSSENVSERLNASSVKSFRWVYNLLESILQDTFQFDNAE